MVTIMCGTIIRLEPIMLKGLHILFLPELPKTFTHFSFLIPIAPPIIPIVPMIISHSV